MVPTDNSTPNSMTRTPCYRGIISTQIRLLHVQGVDENLFARNYREMVDQYTNSFSELTFDIITRDALLCKCVTVNVCISGYSTSTSSSKNICKVSISL